MDGSGVRLGGGGRAGADGGVLVARSIAALWGQRVGVQGLAPPPGGQQGPVWGQRWRGLPRLGEDEVALVGGLQAGHVLHHGLAVGDGQLVGAVRHQVEVAGDEDCGQGQQGREDKGVAHAQRPGGVALEPLLGLGGNGCTV